MIKTLPPRITELLVAGQERGNRQQFAEALACFRQVIELVPDLPQGHFNAGVAYRGLGNLDEAKRAFVEAVRLAPTWLEALFNLANALRDSGDREGAIAAYQRALAIDPKYIKALTNLGNLKCDQGDLDEAEQLLKQVVAWQPSKPAGWFNLCRVVRRQRRFHDAVLFAQRAAELAPDDIRNQRVLVELQRQVGCGPPTLDACNNILEIDPHNIAVALHRIYQLRDQGAAAQALTALDRLANATEDKYELHPLRAELLGILGRRMEAIELLDRWLDIGAANGEGFNLRGALRMAAGDPEAALDDYDRALQRRCDLPEVHNNRGVALHALRRFEEARQAYHHALELRPEFAEARLNNALSLLGDGDFQRGWEEYEVRFQLPRFQLPAISVPRWRGESLVGKTILLRAEQGLGDTLQFIRYAKLLQELGGRVVVESQSGLCELVARVQGVAQVVPRGALLGSYEYECPLLSVPLRLQTSLTTIPNSVPYLAADEAKVSYWQERLASLGRFLVGIAWQGNPQYATDSLRSIPLNAFRTLAGIPGVAVISVQRPSNPQAKLEKPFSFYDFGDELDVAFPFRDTVAILKACDLVVVSDSAVAHLAGALGRPVWLATSFSPDWRWRGETETSVWYPTMRLYRQTKLGDWDSVFVRIANDLTALLQRQ